MNLTDLLYNPKARNGGCNGEGDQQDQRNNHQHHGFYCEEM